jgi:hypothetical protein
MRIPWKAIGMAGAAGVAATGVAVVARQLRSHREYELDELRDRLRQRLSEVRPLENDKDPA